MTYVDYIFAKTESKQHMKISCSAHVELQHAHALK